MSDESKSGTGPDPFSLWRQIMAVNEEAISNALNQYVNSENYASTMGKYVENAMGMQKNIQEAMEKYLHANGLPTRSDFSRLAGQIVGIDERLDDLQDKLNDELSTIDLKKLILKVEALEEKIASIEKTVEQSLKQPAQPGFDPTQYEERLSKIEALLEQISKALGELKKQEALKKPEVNISNRPEKISAKLETPASVLINTGLEDYKPELEGYLALGDDVPIIKKTARRKNLPVTG